MQYCPNYSIPVHTIDNTKDDALLLRVRCKQWSCDYCANINKRIWQARIMLHTPSKPMWSFFTFTLDGKDHTTQPQSLQSWRKVWDKFSKRLKRQYGKYDYLRVFETHKSDIFHVHMLASFMPDDLQYNKEADGRVNWTSATIQGHLEDVELGYRHDCKPLVCTDADTRFQPWDNVKSNSHSEETCALVGAYISKYLTKDIQSDVRQNLADAGMSRVRMIQTSQKWAQIPTRETTRKWEAGALTRWEIETLWDDKKDLIDIDRDRLRVSDDHIGDWNTYPNKDSDTAMQYE